jgi:hypothetical protein
MWLYDVKKSPRKDKRMVATFCLCSDKKGSCGGTNFKKVHFGQPGATTYIDGASDEKRNAYLARHSKSPGEDWEKPDTAGALSRWLLWEARSLKEAEKRFKKKFKL